MHFWSFLAKYCHFLHIFSNARPKTNVNKVPRWVFRYVGNKTFDFSSKKNDFLPKKNQIQPEIGISVNCLLIWCPVGGLAGGCGVGCISQDTYLLYNDKEWGKVFKVEQNGAKDLMGDITNILFSTSDFPLLLHEDVDSVFLGKALHS